MTKLIKENFKMKYLFAAILLLFMTTTSLAGEVKKVIDCSVTVSGTYATGSGTLYKVDGKSRVLTCGHVLDGEICGDAFVISVYQDKIKSDGTREKTGTLARVLSVDFIKDIAVLETFDPEYGNGFAEFYQGPIPEVGTTVYHVGAFWGPELYNSFSAGVISYTDRILPDGEGKFDQTTTILYPGSSGGGVYLEDGRYIGMVLRRHLKGSGIGFYRPIRSMNFDGKP